MSAGVLLLLLGLAAALGFLGWTMSFRQARFRAWIRRGREGRALSAGREEGAFYANRIFGTMLMSFGLIVAVFVTTFYFVTR